MSNSLLNNQNTDSMMFLKQYCKTNILLWLILTSYFHLWLYNFSKSALIWNILLYHYCFLYIHFAYVIEYNLSFKIYDCLEKIVFLAPYGPQQFSGSEYDSHDEESDDSEDSDDSDDSENSDDSDDSDDSEENDDFAPKEQNMTRNSDEEKNYNDPQFLFYDEHSDLLGIPSTEDVNRDDFIDLKKEDIPFENKKSSGNTWNWLFNKQNKKD